MEEEELRLCSHPPRSRCRRDSPPGPWQGGSDRCRLPARPRCHLSFISASRTNWLQVPGCAARTARPRCGHVVCVPSLPPQPNGAFPVSLEAIAARGGGIAAPSHADPLHPWLVWFPGAGGFLALSPVEDGTGRAWVALQHILLWGPSLVLLIWETHIAAQPRLLHVSLPSAGQSPRFPAMCWVLVGQGCPPGTRHTVMWGSRWYWWGRSSWSRPCGMMPHGQAGG